MRTSAGLPWIAPVVVLALAVAGCAGTGQDDAGTGGAPGQDDPAALVEQALQARQASDYDGFVASLRSASQACADPGTAARLGEVAEIAASWSAAVLDGRPKVQATTERLLDGVAWADLTAACGS